MNKDTIEEIRRNFLENCPYWEKLTPQQIEWIVSALQQSFHAGLQRAGEIEKEMAENNKKYPMLDNDGEPLGGWNGGYASACKEFERRLKEKLTPTE